MTREPPEPAAPATPTPPTAPEAGQHLDPDQVAKRQSLAADLRTLNRWASGGGGRAGTAALPAGTPSEEPEAPEGQQSATRRLRTMLGRTPLDPGSAGS